MQILPDDPSKKPQSKQLQARAEYLLKLLKKEQESSELSKTGEEVPTGLTHSPRFSPQRPLTFESAQAALNHSAFSSFLRPKLRRGSVRRRRRSPSRTSRATTSAPLTFPITRLRKARSRSVRSPPAQHHHHHHHQLICSREKSHGCLLSRMMEERSPPPGKDQRRTTKRTRKNRELLKRTRREESRVPKPEKKRSFCFLDSPRSLHFF